MRGYGGCWLCGALHHCSGVKCAPSTDAKLTRGKDAWPKMRPLRDYVVLVEIRLLRGSALNREEEQEGSKRSPKRTTTWARYAMM